MRAIILISILFFSNFSMGLERCGVPEISESEKFFIDIQTQLLSSSFRYMSTDSFKTKVIPVIFHIIEKNVSDQTVYEQMDILNNTFALTGFRFELKNINFVNSAEWARSMDIYSQEEFDMKSQLRQGDSATLNIYTLPNLGGVLGWAYFPSQYKSQPELDGVVIARGSLPGGALYPYNEGITLVHEVGHWMGLFHTFQGGCSGNGDFIDDTPAQQSPSAGCPLANDSCPHLPGLDPSTNYMDYSDDVCLNNFSNGQVVRMTMSFETYRKSI